MSIQVNLLPPQHRPQPSVRLWPVLITIVLTVYLLSISIYWITLSLDWTETKNKVLSVENEISQLQHQVDENIWKEELQVQVSRHKAYIDTEIASSILWHPATAALERAMLPGLFIETLNFSSSGDIRISGTVNTVETVAKFWGSIQAESGLEIVRLSTVTPGQKFDILLRSWYGREVEEEHGD